MRFQLILFVTAVAFQRASLSRIDEERIYSEITDESKTRSCDEHTRHVFSGLGSISILCLLAILLLYSVFARLRNLHGKIVVSCALSTLFATVFLLMVYNHNFQIQENRSTDNMQETNGTTSNRTENTEHGLTQSNDSNTTQTPQNESENNNSSQEDHNVRHWKHNGIWKTEGGNQHFDPDCYNINNKSLNLSCVESKLESTSTCAIVGHLGLFANLSMFSWMTVMCFNMLRTFRRMEPRIINSNFRRFLAYSTFGWGFPFLITLLALAAKIVFHKDSPYNPMIGETVCFIDNEDPRRQLIFFYLPMSLLLLLNLIGFIFCVINLRANSRGFSARRKRLGSAFSKLAMGRETRIQMVTFTNLNIRISIIFVLTDTQHETFSGLWILVVF